MRCQRCSLISVGAHCYSCILSACIGACWFSLIAIALRWLSTICFVFALICIHFIEFHRLTFDHCLVFLLISLDRHWWSLIYIRYHWFNLVFIDSNFHWNSLISIGSHWFLLICISYSSFSSVVLDLLSCFLESHCFSFVFICHWLSLISDYYIWASSSLICNAVHHLPLLLIESHWLSGVFIHVHWFELPSIAYHWCWLVFICFHVFLIDANGFPWLSRLLVFIMMDCYSVVVVDFQSFSSLFIQVHWLSLMILESYYLLLFIAFHSFSWILIDWHGFSLIFIDFPWWSLIPIGFQLVWWSFIDNHWLFACFHWCLFIVIDFCLFSIDYLLLCLIFMGFHWFSLILSSGFPAIYIGIRQHTAAHHSSLQQVESFAMQSIVM